MNAWETCLLEHNLVSCHTFKDLFLVLSQEITLLTRKQTELFSQPPCPFHRLSPRNNFTKSSWAYRNWNLVKIIFVLTLIGMISSGHEFAYATTAELSWHVQNRDMKLSFMMTSSNRHFSALLAFCENLPVTSAFPSQRSVTRGIDIFFDLHLNKRLSKTPRRRWFETPSRSLWRNCNNFSCFTYPYFQKFHSWPHSWNGFLLTYSDPNKMASISQTTFSTIFSWFFFHWRSYMYS